VIWCSSHLFPRIAPTTYKHTGRPVCRKIKSTHCRPTVVSVLSLTLRPCDARCRVNAVLSFIPLNSFGEKTSKVSDMVETISMMPLLLSVSPRFVLPVRCRPVRKRPYTTVIAKPSEFTREKNRNYTHSVVSYSVNLRRNIPGTLTLSLAKMTSAP
jgi:hypothetical protein